jgi:hypothetical protein
MAAVFDEVGHVRADGEEFPAIYSLDRRLRRM